MARRRRALALPGPPASLALALSLFCALVLSGSLPTATASAKHAPKKLAAEAPAPPATAGAPVTEPTPSASPAVKVPKGRGQGRGPNAAAGSGAGQAAGSEAPVAGAAKPGRATKARPAGSRADERRARKNAEKSSQPAASNAGQGSPSAVAQAQSAAKSRRERERERERRRREHHAEKEGPRESRKEREAREKEEAARPPAPQPVAIAAAVGSAPAVTAPPASAAGSPLPKIVGEQTARSTGARRAVHVRSRPSVQHGAVAPVPVTVSAVPIADKSSVPPQHVAAHKPAKRTGAGAQLVTTVTRIIGVVPPLLWLLVGVLGLLAAAFAVSSRIAARRAGALARQRKTLLEDVGLMQAALLPELPARLGPVGTTAAYRPASGPAAGGDFYDLFGLPDGQLAVIVGDVSGHGREALPHTTLLRFTLRAYMEAGLGPRESLRTAAPILERQLGGSFATVVLAVYNPRERTLTYACAGHPHPLLTGLPADAAITACSAPPIGADRITGTRQTVVSIPGAAIVCFYTDGVIEARVQEGLFGVERLAGSLGAISETATAASLLDRVSAEADRRPDDMAACLLRIEGGSESPAILTEELELDSTELGRRRVARFLAAAGLGEREIEQTLESARRMTAGHVSALLQIRLGDGPPEVSVRNDNVAPLRARSIARSQEVAL
jgi:hypothetical protein